jgi:hypothetical protein
MALDRIAKIGPMRNNLGRVAFSLGVALFIAGRDLSGMPLFFAIAIFFAIAMVATLEADGIFDSLRRRRS